MPLPSPTGLRASAPRFVGADRRRRARGPLFGPPIVAGGSVLLAAWIVAAAASVALRGTTPSTGIAVRSVLDAAAATVAATAGILSILHFRLVGRTRALWAGAAFLLLGGMVVPALGAAAGSGPRLAAVRSACELSALALLVTAAARPQIESHLRPLHVLAWAVTVPSASTALLLGFPAVADLVAAQHEAVALAWAAGAIGFVLRARRDQDPADSWRSLVLVGVASAEVMAALARRDGGAWSVGEGAVLIAAMALAVVGTSRSLLAAYLDQRRAADALGIAAEDADLRSHARQHDVSNVLTALGGAALTLERYHRQLPEEDREALTRSLGQEVAKLHSAMVDTPPGVEAFPLRSTVVPDVDHRLAVDVPGALWAVGDPAATTMAVSLLVAHACSRDRPESVTVRGGKDGGWVVLRIEDGGAPQARATRQTLATDPSSPIAAAARSMRAQGGDLWVETRRGRTAVCICLPSAHEQDR